MATEDPAFLWETEAIRSIPMPAGRPPGAPNPDTDDWLTLREASEVTGVPVGTIRKWARQENIPSFLEDSAEGRLRMVSLEGIRRWADRIGREIGDVEAPPVDTPAEATEAETPGPGTAGPAEPEATETVVPPDTMLVPLDAWNKMLNQLGNLHQAGQQLAEARERAAKAETEAGFLKERLAEMRAELERTRAAIEAREQATAPPEPEAEDRQEEGPEEAGLDMRSYTAAMARHLYRRLRERARK